MGREVLVALLKSVVFLDIMEIVASDDHRALHLETLDHSGQDPATNTHIASERTLLVDVRAIDGLRAMESILLFSERIDCVANDCTTTSS